MSEITKNVMEKLVDYIKESGASLEVELIGTWIWVTGDTKPHKDTLKEIGCTWHKTKSCWVYHEAPYRRYGKRETPLDDIRMNYGSVRLV